MILAIGWQADRETAMRGNWRI